MNSLINLFKKGDNQSNKRRKTLLPNLKRVDSNTDNENISKEINIKNDDDQYRKNSTEIIENYLKIDQKNNFSILDEEEILIIKQTYDRYKEDEETKFDNTNIIMNSILNYICNSSITDDIFIISLNISKKITKSNKLNKNYIDDIINQILGDSKKNIYNNKTLKLDKEFCEIIGSLLCYSYPRLQQEYKIKDINTLLQIRKNVISKGIDVQRDFTNYIKENGNTEEKITYFWKKKRNKYDCLPEFIFLINRYSQVSEVEIDINLFDNNITDDMTKIIELTLLNIHLIFTSLKSFKINFIHENLQQNLFSYYSKKLNIINSYNNENNKMNNLIYKTDVFQKKWNFKNFFELEIYRNHENHKKIKFNINSDNNMINNNSLETSTLQDNLSNLSFNDTKRMSIINFMGNISHKNNFDSNNSCEIKINKKEMDNETITKDKDKEKDKDTSEYILKNYSNILELLIMTLFCLNNSDKNINLELIMNDSYTRELLLILKYLYEIEGITGNFDEFNILDLLIYNNIMKYILQFNIEINSLDMISFDKLLNFLNYNQSITSLNISFFSSKLTYFPEFLLKISVKNIYHDLSILDESSNISFNNITDIEEKFLNNLFSSFIHNLSVLFDIIIKMKNLDQLCFNFDIPYNIINKTFYMNSILKFVLNILYYISNNRKIIKFCLLSPNTVFDNKKISNINTILNNINIKKDSSLKDLSIHFQFYNIPEINNFVNTNIQILNIGDLDFDTFKILCNNILSIHFSKNSSLEKLSIGLVKCITDFSIELKLLFKKLFSLKMKNLISLGIYSNIFISDEIEYDYLLKILNNNWISEYTIVMNISSEPYILNFPEDTKKLRFFIPHNLEEKLLESKDIINLQNNPLALEIGKNKDYYDDAYYILKYLFQKVYIDEFNNEQRIIEIVMGILKYLYFLKIPKIKQYFVQIGNNF